MWFLFIVPVFLKLNDLNKSNFMYEEIETPHGRFDSYVDIARKRFYNYGMGSFGI